MRHKEYKYFEYEWDSQESDYELKNRIEWIQEKIDIVDSQGWDILQIHESFQGMKEVFKISFWAKKMIK